MERISLNKEVSLSRIVYGMWRLGDDKNTSPEHVRAKIDASLDRQTWFEIYTAALGREVA